MEAPARRRVRLRPRARRPGQPRQARLATWAATATRCGTRDTFAYGDDTDPDLRVDPVLHGDARTAARTASSSTTPTAPRFDVGPRVARRLLVLRRRGRRAQLLLHRRARRRSSVVERYTALTGRMPLPPRWALGYHQCRYSYYPESKVRVHRRQLPRAADPGRRDLARHPLPRTATSPFTWDQERFPDPARSSPTCGAQGFTVVTIVDPHPQKEPGCAPSTTAGLAGDHFVKNPDGTGLRGAGLARRNAEKNPGPASSPTSASPRRASGGAGSARCLTDMGVAGIWNDMNEPAVFTPPRPHDAARQCATTTRASRPTTARSTTSTAMLDDALDLRGPAAPAAATSGRSCSPAPPTRAASATPRVWPGDNVGDWDDSARDHPHAHRASGLSGLPVRGHRHRRLRRTRRRPSCSRAGCRLGVFYPFMRTHTTLRHARPGAVVVTAPRHEAINRRAIELRYELLPHIYNVMRGGERARACPAFRPLLLEYPDDPATWERDDEFLFGRDLLVAPVLREAQTDREVYLPEGRLVRPTGPAGRCEGGALAQVPVTLERDARSSSRAGAFVFRQPVVQHTGEMPGQPLIVASSPRDALGGRRSTRTTATARWRTSAGLVTRRRFEQQRDATGVRVRVGARPRAPTGRRRRDLSCSQRAGLRPRGAGLVDGTAVGAGDTARRREGRRLGRIVRRRGHGRGCAIRPRRRGRAEF